MSTASRHCSIPRWAAISVSVVGLVGSAMLVEGSAGAQPNPQFPKDVWVQCTGFSGPSASWPHPLTGCSTKLQRGSGYSSKNPPATETIFWNAPFLKGQSMTLVNITNQPLGPDPACPATQPVAVNVSGSIGPDAKRFKNSPVSATICAGASDFSLKPGTLFVVRKVAGQPDNNDDC